MKESKVVPAEPQPGESHKEADDGFQAKFESGDLLQNNGRMRSNRRSIIVVIFGTIVVLFYGWALPSNPLHWIGLCLWGPSELLWIVARLQLGASFAVKAEAHALITSGLYSRIQNPVYVFGSMTLAGIMLYLNQSWYLLAFLVIVPLQVIRARRERKLLMGKFGDLYLQYRSRTWF